MQGLASSRHKTAMHRKGLSRPVRIALEDGIIEPSKSLMDYGCGRGGDLKRLRSREIDCWGWDPVHRPEGRRDDADVVNLGYVLNVIEDLDERIGTLKAAYQHAKKVLIVSARLDQEGPGGHDDTFADGYVTKLGTFQKYYEQGELGAFLTAALDVQPVAAGPGLFYIFRDDSDRETFLASRVRRRSAMPRWRRSEVLFSEHQELLQPLIEFFVARGRLPADQLELSSCAEIEEVFGTVRQAFAVVRRAADRSDWARIRHERLQDLLVYLALSNFSGRGRFSDLPRSLQLDIRSFCSSYKSACAEADLLLLVTGDLELLGKACRSSKIGKQTPSALYVHASAVDALSPLLRVYDGCARAFTGNVDEANLIKFHRDQPAVSYLSYPEFDKDPHPVLAASTTVLLSRNRAKYRSYRKRENPPILHRKEDFVPEDYPGRAKFARLTKCEESWGLYANPSEIGTRDGWNTVLGRYGYELRGHRLVRSAKS